MQNNNLRYNPRLFLLGGMLFLLASLIFWSMKARLQVRPVKKVGSVRMPVAIISPPLSPFQEGRLTLANASGALVLGSLVVLALLFAHFFPLQGSLPAKVSTPPVQQRAFQKGIIYPRWQANAYGSSDTTWQEGIKVVKTQTSAGWIEMPVLFSQRDSNSNTVQNSQSTISTEAFNSGIIAAHALGYHVFFVPLMQVQAKGGWSGSIQPSSQQLQSRFDSYWHTLQPYAQVAANNGVEQMAIATELQSLQQSAPPSLWHQLIIRESSIFKNPLTYDMNWSSLTQPTPSWLKDPGLAMIGVSSYIPLLDTAQRINPQAMPALWSEKVKSKLDALASRVGKHVLITEIGYRNSTDALYHSWESTTTALPDPQEQAGAYDATLSNIYKDPQIVGVFFWGWDDVGRFSIKGQPAVQVLHKWYSLSSM